MRVFITGATGLVGRHVVKALLEHGDHVVTVSRNMSHARSVLGECAEVVPGNPRQAGDWAHAVSGCEGVINLAGEPVAGRRWNERVKQEILASRVETTRNVVCAVEEADSPPCVFISVSASGYYGNTGWETPVDETHPAGSDFLAQVCQQWERAATDRRVAACPTDGVGTSPVGQATTLHLRTIILRLAIVLDPQGGALAKMLLPFRLGLGGPVGSGQQPCPWIHIDDLVGMILWALDNPAVAGVLNACAPEAVNQKEFAQTLGRVLHRPAFLTMPAFMLQLLFGEGANVLLSGQRMVPKRAGELGYEFKHPGLEEALRDLLT